MLGDKGWGLRLFYPSSCRYRSVYCEKKFSQYLGEICYMAQLSKIEENIIYKYKIYFKL